MNDNHFLDLLFSSEVSKDYVHLIIGTICDLNTLIWKHPWMVRAFIDGESGRPMAMCGLIVRGSIWRALTDSDNLRGATSISGDAVLEMQIDSQHHTVGLTALVIDQENPTITLQFAKGELKDFFCPGDAFAPKLWWNYSWKVRAFVFDHKTAPIAQCEILASKRDPVAVFKHKLKLAVATILSPVFFRSENSAAGPAHPP